MAGRAIISTGSRRRRRRGGRQWSCGGVARQGTAWLGEMFLTAAAAAGAASPY